VSPLDQSSPESGVAQQALLELSHASAIVLVIVSQEMEKAMQSQDPKLNRVGMAGVPSLTSCDAARNHDVAEEGARIARI